MGNCVCRSKYAPLGSEASSSSGDRRPLLQQGSDTSSSHPRESAQARQTESRTLSQSGEGSTRARQTQSRTLSQPVKGSTRARQTKSDALPRRIQESTQARQTQSDTLPRRTQAQSHSLRLRKGNKELECSPRQLEIILTSMATYLQRKGEQITIIGIGIGWFKYKNKRFAGSRHDFNYLGSNITEEHRIWLIKAARHAAKKMQPQWEQGWFDNRYVRLPPRIHDIVTRETVENNEELLRGSDDKPGNRGLRVLLPPREYAVCVKLDMIYNNYYSINSMPCPSFEKKEVGGYLLKAIKPSIRGLEKVHLQDIFRWGEHYQLPVRPAILDEVIQFCRTEDLLLMTHAGEAGNLLVPRVFAALNLLGNRDPANTLLSYRDLDNAVEWMS